MSQMNIHIAGLSGRNRGGGMFMFVGPGGPGMGMPGSRAGGPPGMGRAGFGGGAPCFGGGRGRSSFFYPEEVDVCPCRMLSSHLLSEM